MIKTPLYEDLNKVYGLPGESLVKLRLPYPMRLSWDKRKIARNIIVHKDVGPAMIEALEEVLKAVGYNYLRENDFDLFGGAYNHRKIRGGEKLSVHSWGVAIDINPHLGPYDYSAYKAGAYIDRQPDVIKQAFIKRGFVNLPWDTMHFQAVSL